MQGDCPLADGMCRAYIWVMMNNKNITDLDPIAGQLVSRDWSPTREGIPLWGLLAWGLLGLSAVLAIVLGIRGAGNPTDQMALCLAMWPLALLVVDVWGLVVALWKKTVGVFVPICLFLMHILIWFWAVYLTHFEVFYRLEPTGPLGGIYVVRWGIVGLLGVIVCGSFVGAVFEILAMTSFFASSSVASPARLGIVESDMVLTGDPIFEIQVMLNNLGYDIGEIDGTLNAKTQAALEQFQMVSGMKPNGNVTVLTLSALREKWRAENTPVPGQSARLFAVHIGRCLGSGARDLWHKVRVG